jgi:predicted negative regulator of RcsB-dependent stress response
MSSALSNMGDLYKMQGKMKEAIHHYESALMQEVLKQNSQDQQLQL